MGMVINPYMFGASPIASPLDIAGCSMWYDASDGSTLFTTQFGSTPSTLTGVVGRWEDKSGNGRHIGQGTAGSLPLWRNNTGYFALDFDGGNDTLQHSMTNTPVSTVFAVARARNVNSDNFAGLITNLTNQMAGVDYVFLRDNLLNRWFDNGTPLAGESLADSSHMWANRVLTNNWNESVITIYTADGTGHPNPVLPTGLNVGLDRNLAHYLAGDVYEIIGYDTILSSTDRNRVENYLAARYGITLP